jgi:hypothetical protein
VSAGLTACRRPAAPALALAACAALALAACGKKRSRAKLVARDAAVATVAAPAAAADAAPPPELPRPPPVVEPTGAAACDRYQAVLIAALACDALAAHRPVLRENLDTLQRNFAAWPKLAPADRAAALASGARQCQGGVDGVTEVMKGAGCPPP